jgi:AcrR family transcriptional regulator
VAVSQRARMLDAVARAVADKGYANVTVADVTSGAGVSRRTFYEQFDDKEACFLTAYETGSAVVLEEVAEAVRAVPQSDWRARLRAALTRYADVLAGEPELARALTVGVLGASPRAIELRRRVYDRFVDHYRGLRAVVESQEPSYPEIPDHYLRALVGGIGELVNEHIFRDGAESLPDLAPTLVEIATAVFEGRAQRAAA